jgi:hypothetical protein
VREQKERQLPDWIEYDHSNAHCAR